MRDEAAAILPFKLRPSREFAVRQATLMVLHTWYSFTIETKGLRYVCEHVLANKNQAFAWDVQQTFREIAARYDLQDAPCR